MSDTATVLIVDDDETSREYLSALLDALGFAVEGAAGGREALERLSRQPAPDVVILDVIMPELDGVETLRRYRAGGGKAPVVMCSALDEADTVVRAMRAGASDYITKPFNAEELREILERVAGGQRATTVATPSPSRARRAAATALGTSPAMRRVDELIDRIADADVPVLITGESGVGKDVVAREIHARSSRAGRVFVKINCAALPGELLESELFGHERGSFTGAQKTKPGQFELADGGTLFLDEIGEMPVTMQAKLLQALQDGEFYRVGGQKKIKVDTRVIVATNVDLAKAMERGTFREDLYYRLNVVEVAIPPLRERREDIPRLLELFVDKYGKRYGRTMARGADGDRRALPDLRLPGQHPRAREPGAAADRAARSALRALGAQGSRHRRAPSTSASPIASRSAMPLAAARAVDDSAADADGADAAGLRVVRLRVAVQHAEPAAAAGDSAAAAGRRLSRRASDRRRRRRAGGRRSRRKRTTTGST